MLKGQNEEVVMPVYWLKVVFSLSHKQANANAETRTLHKQAQRMEERRFGDETEVFTRQTPRKGSKYYRDEMMMELRSYQAD